MIPKTPQPAFIYPKDWISFTFCLIGFLGCGLASFSGWQGFLGPDDNCSASEGSFGEILAVSLLHNQSLDLVQRSSGSSLHGHGLFALGDLCTWKNFWGGTLFQIIHVLAGRLRTIRTQLNWETDIEFQINFQTNLINLRPSRAFVAAFTMSFLSRASTAPWVFNI